MSRPILEGLTCSRLEGRDKDGLEILFMEKEVKEAVWSCDENKSSGPNGISLDFFKKNWGVVKEDVMRFVGDFHSKAILTKACTSSFINLIPKLSNPQLLSQYRITCLVSSLYKILSKLLASRLKNVIGKLISVKQSAFIKGISILDGILWLTKFLTWLRGRREVVWC
ncbi:uncharacterized protein LOC131640079 [Vicia villosa]|uniref:uncharacterized protein LOC131640079 n=1 Tax=Vicia villosa TaxID=3911 RepID=UPI00273ABAE5|nr:uncharacterized protein LOC131640079 [Vicia villosa]